MQNKLEKYNELETNNTFGSERFILTNVQRHFTHAMTEEMCATTFVNDGRNMSEWFLHKAC